MNPSLRPSSSVMRAARPTSEPVPAVVGIAMTGATAPVILEMPAVDRGVGFERSGMVCQQRNTFGEIDRRAASHRADAIAPVSLVHRQRRARCRFGRVGGHVEKHRRARRTKPLDSLYEPGCRKPAIAHDQRTRNADGRQLIRQRRQRSRTELNCRQICDRCHRLTQSIIERQANMVHHARGRHWGHGAHRFVPGAEARRLRVRDRLRLAASEAAVCCRRALGDGRPCRDRSGRGRTARAIRRTDRRAPPERRDRPDVLYARQRRGAIECACRSRRSPDSLRHNLGARSERGSAHDRGRPTAAVR